MLSKAIPLLLLAAIAFVAQPLHASVIVPASTYEMWILQTPPFRTNLQTTVTFDGVDEQFNLNHGGVATISEREIDLGGGDYLLEISVSSTADLFPDLGASDAVAVFATLNDPFDFSEEVTLSSAIIELFTDAGSLQETDWIGGITQKDPWDGRLLRPGIGAGYAEAIGLGINRVEFRYRVSHNPVPEPTALWIWLITLSSVSLVVHRCRSKRTIASQS